MIDYAAAALIVLVAGVLIVYRHWLAAIWFRMEDPRTLGLFRIALGSLLLGNLISLAPLHEYLYTSEGLVTGEQARAFRGEWRLSLLYHFDSIEFVAAYTGVLWIACVAFTVGFATSVTKWLTWFLFLGTIARNVVALQGDHIFASYLFYLCLSRCDESFSIDAWIRRIRDPGLPHHRAIPAWPRNLMILQMIPMLCANGLAKSGELWRSGDMVYMVVNEPLFRPAPMWEVSAIFATNLFRLMTWVSHAFEILFPLVIVGLVADLVRRHALPAPRRSAVWIGRALFFALGIVILYFVATADWQASDLASVLTCATGLALCVAPLTLKLARRIPERARRWLLGRRVWATLLVVFMGQLFFVLRIDWFPGATMACALLLFEGDELGAAWARWTRRPARPTGPARTSELSPRRRRFVALLSGFHVLAITLTLLPHAKPTAAWRKTLEQPMTAWIQSTVGFQFWRMFANGDQAWSEIEFEVMLHDSRGNWLWVGDGILPSDDPRALDRREKARSNLLSGKRLRVAHARWVCRNFMVPGGDDIVVTFFRKRRSVPTPEELAVIGPEHVEAHMEASSRSKQLFQHRCGN